VLVQRLAAIEPVTSLQALAKSIASANRVSNAIADNNWALLEKVWGGAGSEGLRIKQSVASALSADELVTALAAALKQAQYDATAIITKPPPPDSPKPPPKGKKVLKQESRQGLSAREAKSLMTEIQADLREGMTVDISYSIIGEDDA